MKKLLTILSIVALTGAGCAKAPVAQKPAETEQPPKMEQTDSSGITTLKTENGGEIKYKTQIPNTIKSGDDVPVTDIYLGDAQVKLDMEVGNMFFKPTIIKAKANDAVQITFTKVEGTHTFMIDGTNANFSIAQGAKNIFTAPAKKGSYPFYCTIKGHREKGMVGTLIVE